MLRNIAKINHIFIIMHRNMTLKARNNALYHIYCMLPLEEGYDGANHIVNTFTCPATMHMLVARFNYVLVTTSNPVMTCASDG